MHATLGIVWPRRRWHWSLTWVLLLLIVVNAGLAVLVFVIPSPSERSAVSVPELPSQIRELQRRIAEGHPGEPYVLSLSDAELSDAAGYYAASAPDVPFTRIRVAVAGGKLGVDAITRGLAVPVPVHATVLLTSIDGSPVAQVEDVRLAGAGLPAFARDQVLRQANQSLDLSRYDLPLSVNSVELAAGRLTISGRLK